MQWEYSLHGIWNFSLDPGNIGMEQNWQKREFSDKIQIPGILQAQGYGEDINETTPWVSGLHDKLWFQREEYKLASEELNVPFLSQPPKHYLGQAWYQKTFIIPGNLGGHTFYFKIEGVKWKTYSWVDGNFKGSETALCTPHVYCLGELGEGEHRIAVCVDNRLQYPYRPDGHMVSDALGVTWNGMVGTVSIIALPNIHIENLRIYPDMDTKRVAVEVLIRNLTKVQQNVRVQVNEVVKSIDAKEELQTVSFALTYPEDTAVWDEYSNALYQVFASLEYNGLRHEKTESFGFRKIEVKEGLFYVNNRPTYFRGTHFGGDFPLTGYPSTEVSDWKRIFGICSTWGLNYIRFHSYCPPEAAFIAADEEGIYLQVECGMWNHFYDGCKMSEVLWEETKRILMAFGNHPSFVMLSPSNEPGGDWYKPLTDWVKKCREMDLRRIYTAQSGWPYPVEPDKIEGTDYVYFHRSGYGIQPGGTIRNSQGWHGKDYRLSVEGIKYPVISHELGQWCSYPDYDVIDKFCGYLQPGNFKVFQESARKQGVLWQAREFAYLSGKLKVQLYKEEIEANFRTPHLYGFELLELHDYLGQGTALVGLLDPFWEEKGFITAEEFRAFCSETVPLLRIAKRVYTTEEALDCPVEFCHFGKEPMKKAYIYWRLLDDNKNAVRQGAFDPMDLPMKKNIVIGSLRINLSDLQAPSAYEIEIGIDHTVIRNSWRFWLYDVQEQEAPFTQVVYTHSFPEAMEALSIGKRVIYAPLPEHHRLDSPPLSARPSFWNSQMGPTYRRGMGLVIEVHHPALALFPTNAYQEWQWEEIMQGAYGLNMKELPGELQPVVQPIDEWNRNYRMGMIMECKVLKGSLLIVTANLEQDLEKRPAARQLRTSLFAYAESRKFCPKVQVSEEALMKSFFQRKIMMDYGVKITLWNQSVINNSDIRQAYNVVQTGQAMEATEADYSAALDGDPNTFVTSSQLQYPFIIELEAEKEVHIKGLVYMPRQNDREHKGDIKGCKVEAFVHDAWIIVYEGELVSSYEPKELLFDEAVWIKRVRFTALYGFSAKGVSVYLEDREGWSQQTMDYEDKVAAIAELLFIPVEMNLNCDAVLLKEGSRNVTQQNTLFAAKSATKEIEY